VQVPAGGRSRAVVGDAAQAGGHRSPTNRRLGPPRLERTAQPAAGSAPASTSIDSTSNSTIA
jgi:hypothetical protein